MPQIKRKPKRRLFCYTVVHEYNENFEVSEAREFLTDIKHAGATAEVIDSIRHTRKATWSEVDETGTSTHAVEVIERD